MVADSKDCKLHATGKFHNLSIEVTVWDEGTQSILYHDDKDGSFIVPPEWLHTAVKTWARDGYAGLSLEEFLKRTFTDNMKCIY